MKIAPFDYIDSEHKLAQFCEKIAQAEWIAVDTEFMRERTYFAQLALIQIASAHGNACIDPVAMGDLTTLAPLMQSANCLKIMHSASQDLEVLKQVMGFVPSPLFDTQIAAGFLGTVEQISYAGIVKAQFGIELSKEQTRTNWLQRPLSAEQIEYAQLDVVYLQDLARLQTEALKAQGKFAWQQQECADLVRRYESAELINQAWMRIQSVHAMAPAAQRVVQALAAWREQLAQQRDLPREWVLNKRAIVEIARAQPSDFQALQALASLTDKQRQRCGKKLLSLVEQSVNSTATLPISPMLDNAQRLWVKRLMAARGDIAEKLGLTPTLLGNRYAIESLVRGERNLPLLQTWRAEQIGNHLLQLLGENSPD